MAQEADKRIDSISWSVPEFDKQERSRLWYILAVVFVILALFFSFFKISSWQIVFLGVQSNFLFALIIVMAAIIMILQQGREPKEVTVSLGAEGVTVGSSFYDYDEFRNFSVLYKPNLAISQLYMEFKGIRQRLSFYLGELNPLDVRNFLVRYLEEDLERNNEPLSEQLTKMLKL